MSRSRAVNLAAFLHTVRRQRRWILQAGLLGLVLGMTPTWSGAQNRPRFEVKNYVITAELLPSQHLLSAKARVDLVPTRI